MGVLLLGGGQGHRLLDAGGRTRLNRRGGRVPGPDKGHTGHFQRGGQWGE